MHEMIVAVLQQKQLGTVHDTFLIYTNVQTLGTSFQGEPPSSSYKYYSLIRNAWTLKKEVRPESLSSKFGNLKIKKCITS